VLTPGATVTVSPRHDAATPEDAEDAYQRAFEILLTKAPSTREEELVPWLKTVVISTSLPQRSGRLAPRPVPTPELVGRGG
jgi:DNA-directed RNA polymerase specialized sigma24 family protein